MNSKIVQKVIGGAPPPGDMLASVVSVLAEGSPELRVALLFLDQGWNEVQIGEFLRSVPELPSPFMTTVINTVRDIERGSSRQDTYTQVAEALKRRLRRQRRAQ